MRNLVRVMCHRFQKSIALVAFSGELKFIGKRMPNNLAAPIAMSEYPEKSK
ncbi:MAG: hypothetical protein LKCHEGNO_00098 [Burkholderiaceae bacterium]|nr:hypothetical protein [Burkholderiaceae bacterium]